MKALRTTTTRQGMRRVTVELEHGETLIAVSKDSHYQLGGQLDDVVASHVIAEVQRVHWCSIEQKWVQA